MPTLDPKSVSVVTEFRGQKQYFDKVSEGLEAVITNNLGICDIFFKDKLACQIYPNGIDQQGKKVIRIRFVDKNFLGLKLSFPYEIMKPRRK